MEEWWESESWAEDTYRLERPRGGLLRTVTGAGDGVPGVHRNWGRRGVGGAEVMKWRCYPIHFSQSPPRPWATEGTGWARGVLTPRRRLTFMPWLLSPLCVLKEGMTNCPPSRGLEWTPALARLRMTVKSLGLAFKALHWTSGLLSLAKGHQPEALTITYVSIQTPVWGCCPCPASSWESLSCSRSNLAL